MDEKKKRRTYLFLILPPLRLIVVFLLNFFKSFRDHCRAVLRCQRNLQKLILILRGVRGEDEQQELGEEDIGKKEEDSREELTPSSSLPVV